jgi:hypothetical protein
LPLEGNFKARLFVDTGFIESRLQSLIELFQAVDANLVRSVCFEYIYDKCPVVAAVGPVENLTDYSRIRSQMYWIRV